MQMEMKGMCKYSLKLSKSAKFAGQFFIVRTFGLQVIKLVTLIRYFGLASGLNIFIQLLFAKKYGELSIRDKYFQFPILLRSHQSDPYIFEQVFVEQQYRFPDRFSKPVKTILDAGANIGMAAIYFTKRFPEADIICIEPDKNNFELLKKNTSPYSNIRCLNAALWNKEETLDIGNKTEFSAGYMVEPIKTENSGIPGLTVNGIMNSFNIEEFSLVKIDIEGAEKEVFEDENNTWINKCDCIIVELHDHMKAGATKSYFSAMSQYDWESYVCGENIVTFKR